MKRKLPAAIKIQPWISLVTALIAISIIAVPAEAMFVPSAPHTQTTPLSDRTADMAKIQKVLESKTLQQRLVDYGLSPEMALTKISGLSDEQLHELATNIDALQAGGMSNSSVIIILLLILLILILI
jgi:hypothetical protein